MKLKTIIPALLIITLTFILFNINYPPDVRKKKMSGAMKSMQLWTQQRAYPNSDVSVTKYFSAFEEAKNLSKVNTIFNDEWKPIGPHNIGGRALAVAFNPQNPNTIFAGAASGGLWKSYTGGKGAMAWEFVNTGFPVLGVSSIEIDPADSNIIFIGTGEVYNFESSLGGVSIRTTRGSYGIGILKTTDGGVTWSKSLDWSYSDNKGVWAVRFNPQNTNTLWAATTDGIYRTYNKGETWEKVHNVIMGNDLIINPLDTNKILTAHGNLGSAGRGIYRSTDGNTFTQITNNIPTNFNGKIQLSYYRKNPEIVYASVGFGFATGAGTNLLRSTNFGETWQLVSDFDYSTYQGWFAHFVVVNPEDSSKLIAAGVDLFKSTNAGATFEQKSFWNLWYFGITQPGEPEGPHNYSHADHHGYAIHPTNSDIIYFANDGGIFRTTDGGETFEGCNGGFQTTQFYKKFSSSFQDSNIAIGGMQDNATAIYLGTVAWKRVLGGDGCCTGIDANNGNILYGSSQNLAVRKSTNLGDNWSFLNIPSGGTTSFNGPFAVSISNPNILFAARNRVYKSTTGGSSWVTVNGNQLLDGNPVLTITIAPNNPNLVYVSTAAVSERCGIFRSTNGGQTFENITGNLPDRYPMDFAVDPEDENIVFVILSGFGGSHIYKSTNKGNDWIDINNNLPDVPTSAILIDPNNSNNIYVGNDIGVFLSTNGGEEWNQFSDGFPGSALIMDLSYSASNNSIKAATHGLGVFERKLYTSTTNVKNENIIKGFELIQNYPNPFNPSTTIEFNLPSPLKGEGTGVRFVTLKVYDILGNEVATLVNEYKKAGSYSVKFSAGSNEDGSNLSSGVYFYSIQAGDFTAVKKMLLMK